MIISRMHMFEVEVLQYGGICICVHLFREFHDLEAFVKITGREYKI